MILELEGEDNLGACVEGCGEPWIKRASSGLEGGYGRARRRGQGRVEKESIFRLPNCARFDTGWMIVVEYPV